MKITKERLKMIILEEIEALKQQKMVEIQAKITHPEGPCGDEGCATCGELEQNEPVFEEET